MACCPVCAWPGPRWSADSLGNEYLVMELLQLGSLDAVLRSIGRQLLTQTKMTIVEQVKRGHREGSCSRVRWHDSRENSGVI